MSVAQKLPQIVMVDKALEDLMVGFIYNRISDLCNIEAAVEKGDWAEAKRYAHTIIGVAGSYGFNQLGEYARSIEEWIEIQARDEILETVCFLKDYLGLVTIIYK